MALSFEDSLKAAQAESEAAAAVAAVSTVAEDTSSVMTLDYDVAANETNEMISAYSGVEYDSNYESYSQYPQNLVDNNISVVDENKNVTLADNQINLTQESNSQYIPFKMPRYYDGFDLSTATLSIYWVNEFGSGSAASPVNVSYDNDCIYFAWLVDSGVTRYSGTVKFEIQARGNIVSDSGINSSYVWKSRPNSELNIIQALSYNEVIEPDEGWQTDFFAEANRMLIDAQDAANNASSAAIRAENAASKATAALDRVDGAVEDAANALADEIDSIVADKLTEEMGAYAKTSDVADVYATKDSIPTMVSELENDSLYATESYVDDAISNADLNKYATVEYVGNIPVGGDENPVADTVIDYVDYKVSTVDVTEQLKDYATKEDVTDAIEAEDITYKLGNYYTKEQTYSKTEVDDVLGNVTVDMSDYYNKTEVDNKVGVLSTGINANTSNISTLTTTVAGLQSTVNNIDTSPRLTYDVAYNDKEDENVGENVFVFYEIENEGKENESKEIKRKFTIVGGGGSGSAAKLIIGYVEGYESPIVVTTNDEAIIKYTFSGKDAYDYDVTEGTATWKVAGRVVATETIVAGENSFDVTEYLAVGTQKVNLIVEEETGGFATRTWNVQKIDVRLDAESFNDKLTYPIDPVSFNYTPYGAVSKDVYFILDGSEIGKVTTSASGVPMTYDIPTQEHGAHLLEAYMKAEINGRTIESNHVIKDIIWYDGESDIPVIGTVYQNFTARQYDATNIQYTVFDPTTANPKVEIAVDGVIVSTPTLNSSTNTYTFRSDVVGEHIITITCGKTVKTIKANIIKLNIDVAPVTGGLAFDFNPSGKSNNDDDRVWTDGKVSMYVSDNFDWINGGYQYDEVGDQYFCVKAGTTATIDYNLFNDDAKSLGKEFKVIFKTKNIRKRDTSFISCMDSGIGLDMKVESANIYSSNGSLYSPYCEEDIIEFEFNINRSDDIPLVLTYEDGVGNRPMIYTSDTSFWQANAKPITIGSDDCDVHIYRMKAYTKSLSDREILANFIADARNATEMIARYDRNQIYDENNMLSPEVLAEKCPDLRIITIDAPWFTNDKDNKVEDTVVRMIYKNGDPILDNWTCNNAKHSGQGTSSNEYGYAGRNIDLIMDGDSALFTLGDGSTSKTITLTRTSVPTDYLNVKVNIASSENQNNAQMAKRYNEYNPFVRSAKFDNSNVKDCMEFYNCVIFVRERDTDIGTHREFLDNEYHFYAIGNVGDSKKTDDTRVNDKNDPKECIVEITDYNVPLAEFPTGNGKDRCLPENWKEGNIAYDYLYAPYKYKENKFKSFGTESYEFRYEMKGITEEQREANINAWRDMYKFVVTSDETEFYNKLKEYFVVNSVLYYYLFTERYTMVDNRAKNSFWHYGKVYITSEEALTLGDRAAAFITDNEQAAINDGYRWDLSFGYDFDTSLGIDNTGKLVLTYGKEDSDYYVDGDPSSSYIYRAAESTFFCRIRDLFASELQSMFVDRENANAWLSSGDSGLIYQWDAAQSQFPEELWRLDIQRKYIRTYKGISIDNSKVGEATPRFLTEMMNGRKKYQRRMFERNQELYMATKYFGKKATQDQIMMRFNNPNSDDMETDYTLYITPYSDMYIGVSFGNVAPINFRAKAGVEYTVPYSIDAATADITLIYGASFIQEIGDLSKCYVGRNDFSKASRLQKLVIGSNRDGYYNSFMEEIALGNNKMIEYLDIRNVTGLNKVVDLSECENLRELHAENSSTPGVIFANGGRIEKFYIPDVASLTLRNLNYIEDFSIANYRNLQTLVVENTPAIDTYEIVNNALKLQTLRLIGINWRIDTTDIFNRMLNMRGFNNDNVEIAQSVLTGYVYVPIIKSQQKLEYKIAWPDLDVESDVEIPQYAVTFVDYDGTVLDVQYVDEGKDAVDPITREENPISIPNKESTVSTDYTFDGWDSGFTVIYGAKTVTAVYKESTRKYTIRYLTKTSTGVKDAQAPVLAEYGTYVPYMGDTPVFKDYENSNEYYMFDRWSQSGYVSGDKDITAEFEVFKYTEGFFDGKDLSDLTPVQIYALFHMIDNEKISIDVTDINIEDVYSFTMGYDINLDGDEDIESIEFISEKSIYDGVSSKYDTGYKFFEEDRDFILAIDYQFDIDASDDSVLAQCHMSNTNIGFKLFNDNGNATLKWGSASIKLAGIGQREMVVISHKKGSNTIEVYNSNLTGTSVTMSEITNANTGTYNDRCTLVFGCEKLANGSFKNYASGNIHWCKAWYADLGKEECKKLANWTHEKIEMKVSSFDQYYLSGENGETCHLTLLATHLLDSNMNYNSNGKNTGGWKQSTLNSFLNGRMYDAVPHQIKSLIKKVDVVSSVGDNSTQTDSSECYLYIPAVGELTTAKDYDKQPYSDELSNGSVTTVISYMTNNTDRKRAYSNGDFSRYWTRSPFLHVNNYICCVDTDGSLYNYVSPKNGNIGYGILLQMSF